MELESNVLQARRRFLRNSACGLGMMAVAELLGGEGRTAESAGGLNPLESKPPHFKPTAKNVIFLFMAGAPSQLDLFDPKPMMQKLHGMPVPESYLKDLDDSLIK